MAKNCDVCGKKIGLLTINLKTKNGLICGDCAEKIGLGIDFKSVSVADYLTIEDVKEHQSAHTKIDVKQYLADLKTKEKEARIDERNEKKSEKDAKKQAYKSEKQLFMDHGARVAGKMHADFKDKKVLFDKEFLVDPKTVPFKDIVSYTPTTGGHSVSKHHRGARGIAGGLIAGPVGAVVAASTGGKDYDVINDAHITVSFKDGTTRTLKYVNADYKSDSLLLKSLMNDYNTGISILEAIIATNQQDMSSITDSANANDQPDVSMTASDTKPTSNQTIDADELIKLKSLVDDGVITQADFDAKKKQILGL